MRCRAVQHGAITPPPVTDYETCWQRPKPKGWQGFLGDCWYNLHIVNFSFMLQDTRPLGQISSISNHQQRLLLHKVTLFADYPSCVQYLPVFSWRLSVTSPSQHLLKSVRVCLSMRSYRGMLDRQLVSILFRFVARELASIYLQGLAR